MIGGATHNVGVRITAENQQLQSTIRQSTRSIQDMGRAAEQSGRQSEQSWSKARVSADGILSTLGKLSGVIAVVGTLGASFSKALSAGWDRLTTLSNATRALTIQMQSAGLAAGLMDETLQVVSGTPYNFDQFARITMQLTSFGVATEDISGHLTALGEAAATRGSEAASIVDRIANAYGRMSTLGTASMRPIRMIEEAGVPALRILANQLGETTERTQEMVTAGLIPAEEAMRHLSSGILEGTSGAAGATVAFAGTMEALREELSGAAGGLQAAMARLGANIWGPLEQALIHGFNSTADSLDAMGGVVNEFLTVTVSAFQDTGHRLRPTLEPLMRVAGNLTDIFLELVDSVGPVARGFGMLTDAIALPILQGLANALEAVSGFLAEYPWLIEAVAAVWAARFLPALAAAIASVITWGTQFVRTMTISRAAAIEMARAQQFSAAAAAAGVTGIRATGTAAQWAAIRVRAFGMALTGSMIAGGAALVGVAALAAGLNHFRKKQDEAVAATREAAEEISASYDPTNLDSFANSMAGLQDQIALMGDMDWLTEDQRPWWQGGMFTSRGDVEEQRQYIAINEEIQALNEKQTNSLRNVNMIMRETGASYEDVAYVMRENRIDLTMESWGKAAEEARGHVVSGLKDIEHAAGTSLADANNHLGLSAEQMEEFSERVNTAMENTLKGLSSTMNVLGRWEPNIGVQEEADAIEALAEAQKDLNEARKDGLSAQQIEAAMKRVADAEAALAEAEKMKAEGTLEAYYQDAITKMESFSRDLNTAVGMGLDTGIVTRIMEMGPEEAAGVLQELISDSTGAMIELANASEEIMADVSARIVEQSRLTARAVNAETDELAKALPDAMTISSMAWDGVYTQDIAEAMGLTEERVREVAKLFNISLSSGFTGTATSKHDEYIDRMNLDQESGRQAGVKFGTGFINGVEVTLSSAPPVGPPVPQTMTPYYAPGSFGHAAGTSSVLPGWTPGRDVHQFYSPTAGRLALSGGEGIARPEFVAALGPARWDALNHAARTGGVSAVQRALGANLGGFANGTSSLSIRPVPVPINQTVERHAPMNIQQMIVGDIGEARRIAGDRFYLDSTDGSRRT